MNDVIIMRKGYLLLIAIALVILTMGTVSAENIEDFAGNGVDSLSCSLDDSVILDTSNFNGDLSESLNDNVVVDTSKDNGDLLSSIDDENNADDLKSGVDEYNSILADEGSNSILAEDEYDYEIHSYVEINSYDISSSNPHSVNINDDSDYVAIIYTNTEASGNVTVYIGKELEDYSEIGFIEDIQSLDHEIDENHPDFSTYYVRPGDLDYAPLDLYYVTVVFQMTKNLQYNETGRVRFVEDPSHVRVDIPPEIVIGDWQQSYFTVFVENNLGYIRVFIDNELVFNDTVDNLVYDENEGYNHFIPIYMGDLTIGSHSYKVEYTDGSWDDETFEGTIDVTYLFDIIYDYEIDYGDDAEFIIVLPVDAAGNEIMVNGNPYEITLTDGVALLTLPDLELGENELIFAYNDANYGEKTLKASVTVNPKLVVPSLTTLGNGDEIIFKLPEDAEGQLNISIINGSETILIGSVDLVNGEASFPLDAFSFGSYELLLEYDDGKYVISNESFVSILPFVDISNETMISENASLSVEIPDVSGSIVVYLNGEEYRVEPLEDGKIDLAIPAEDLHLGENIVTLSYEGSDLDSNPFTYNENGETVSFEYVIMVKPTELIIPDEFTADGNGEISIELPEGSSGQLAVYVNGELVSTTPVSSGTNNIQLSDLAAGDNEVKVVFTDGEGNEYASSKNVTVPKTVPSMDISIPQDSTIPEFSIDLPADATGSLVVNINGRNYVIELENGKAAISISGLPDGTYDLTIMYTGDKKYGGFNKKTAVTLKAVVKPVVLKDPALKIAVPDTYKSNKAVVTVTADAAFSGKVVVKIKSKSYTVNVVNGKGTISISGLAIGTYTATASFGGDGKFKSAASSKSFKVKADVIKLTLKKVKVKKSAKKLVVKATLKINGKLVKGKKLTFKFNKKTYKAKTNKKGIAKITIKKKVLKKLKVGKKVKYQVKYGKKTAKRTVKVKK